MTTWSERCISWSWPNTDHSGNALHAPHPPHVDSHRAVPARAAGDRCLRTVPDARSPANHATLDGFQCTTSVAGPVLDALTATASLGLAFKSVTEDPGYDADAVNEALAVGIAQATLWGISAIVGFDKVSKCTKAQRQLAERRSHAPPTVAAVPLVPSPVQTVVVIPAVDTLSTEGHLQLVADPRAGRRRASVARFPVVVVQRRRRLGQRLRAGHGARSGHSPDRGDRGQRRRDGASRGTSPERWRWPNAPLRSA